ncbi:MAG: hypothetical protein LBC82_03740 [Oscillospiraceae bacterium]|jgi:hypothetical protein|nr:hypothetical protein [Oscillospiraceae bacterium]
MAFETKAFLSTLADNIAKSKTVKEVYMTVMKAANVEGLSVPTYEEAIKELEDSRR